MARYAMLIEEKDVFGTQKELVDTVDVIHPIVTAIKSGCGLTAIEVTKVWEDDHCPCFNVKMWVNNGKVYYINFSWMTNWFEQSLFDACSQNTTKMMRAFRRLEKTINQTSSLAR